jgi:hypothetical protein
MTEEQQIAKAREMYLQGGWINNIAAELHLGNAKIKRWVADIKRPRKKRTDFTKQKPVGLDAYREPSVEKLIAASEAFLADLERERGLAKRSKLITATNACIADLRREHGRVRPAKDGVNAG